MKLIRAITWGIALAILIFFETSILLFGFKLNPENYVYYIIHIPLLIIFTLLCSISYFWKKEIKGSLLHGFLVGIIFVLITILINAIITIPLFIKDYAFLLRTDIILGELLIVFLTTLVGWAKR